MSRTRLLFVLHSLSIGGAERLVVQIAESLPQEQFEIGICCLDSRGALWGECQSRGYQLFEVNRTPGWSWKSFAGIQNAIADFEPDIIHAQQYTPFVYAVIGKLLSRVQANIIFTEHGRHYPDIVSTKRRAANCILKFFARKVTAVSEFSKDALSQREGFTARPIEVIYNGLAKLPSRKEAISIHQELALPEDRQLIGYVGSLREVKNPAYLLEAFALLAEEEPSVSLVYIGDGPLRAGLEASVERLGLSERVHFLGAKDPATPYLHSLSLFVLPSHSEAASLALLEAMASSLPVIATNTGGTPELLADGDNGILIPTDDPARFAQSMRTLLRTPQQREALGKRAQATVKERFSFETMVSSYIRIYEELC